jgi:hypothetical protein
MRAIEVVIWEIILRRVHIMAIRFLDAEEAERFRKGINSDPEFKLAARHMTKDVLLEIGDSQRIVRVRDGVITEIKQAPTFMDQWSFAVKGPIESWEKFLEPVPPPFYTSLFAAMIRATMSVVGDLEAAFAHFGATNRILNFMREKQNA